MKKATTPLQAGAALSSFREKVIKFRRPIAALLWWTYLIVGFYLIVGIVLFPSWWKRAIFHFDLVDLQFVRFALHFLYSLLTSFHPLGLLLLGIALFAGIWGVFHYGRHGPGKIIDHIQPPARSLRVFVTIVLACTFVSLLFASTYQTPDEINKLIEDARAEAERPFDEFANEVSYAPDSGYFLYLDASRVRSIYSSLQSSLEIERHVTKSERERKLGVEANIPRIKIDASGRVVEEETTSKVPVAMTPERQAKHLIDYCIKEGKPTTENAERELKKIEHALATLREAGIVLEPQQEESAINRITQLLQRDDQARGVLGMNGRTVIDFSKSEKTYSFKYSPVRVARVTSTGQLEPEFMDGLLAKSLSITNATSMRCSILYVVLERTSSGTNLISTLLPIAIW